MHHRKRWNNDVKRSLFFFLLNPMSNIALVIEERAHEVGNFLVGRLLPFHSKRMVGPFIFIDHMGPAEFRANENFDVGPHPHIGLSTLTYLFEGSVMHRDSLGTSIEIKPGQVNWMTAGHGIVHSERTPDHVRPIAKRMHGLQIWVALPKDDEDTEPNFYHADEDELPAWHDNGAQYRLIAGSVMGHRSPVPVYSPLYLLEIKTHETTTITIGDQLFGESGLYILEGSVESDGTIFEPRRILIAKDSTLCSFTMHAGSTVYIFGGEPFAEPRFMYWNFVATSRERLESAKERWQNQEFPAIAGETEFVPLPVSKS